jgi:hypothetical protein
MDDKSSIYPKLIARIKELEEQLLERDMEILILTQENEELRNTMPALEEPGKL